MYSALSTREIGNASLGIDQGTWGLSMCLSESLDPLREWRPACRFVLLQPKVCWSFVPQGDWKCLINFSSCQPPLPPILCLRWTPFASLYSLSMFLHVWSTGQNALVTSWNSPALESDGAHSQTPPQIDSDSLRGCLGIFCLISSQVTCTLRFERCCSAYCYQGVRPRSSPRRFSFPSNSWASSSLYPSVTSTALKDSRDKETPQIIA
jgi:hypothetical protein